MRGCKKPPFRFWIAVMIFFSTFKSYMLRANIAVSIVAMSSPPLDAKSNGTELIACQKASETEQSTEAEATQFHWDEWQISYILMGYFFGILFTVLLGGPLSEWIGPWHVIFWSSLGMGVMTALTPLTANLWDYIGVAVNRTIVGIFTGPNYPAYNVIIARWAPPHEKGKFLSAMLGNAMGTVFTWIAVGMVPPSHWEWGFYLVAIAMGVYLVAFFFVVDDSPEKSRWISKEERDFIFASQEGHLSKKPGKLPVLSILTSTHFWAVVSGQVGNLWILNLIMTFLPKYITEILGFDLKLSALLASLPYLTRMPSSMVFGLFSDYIRRKGLMTLTTSRKFFMIFSHGLSGLCYILIYPSGCTIPAVLVLLVLNQTFNGAVAVSHLVNCQDLAPNFAGTLYGIMNFFAMGTGVLVPFLSGVILTTEKDTPIRAGAHIFALGGIAIIAFGSLFVLFGSAQVQSWNKVEDSDEPQQPGMAKEG